MMKNMIVMMVLLQVSCGQHDAGRSEVVYATSDYARGVKDASQALARGEQVVTFGISPDSTKEEQDAFRKVLKVDYGLKYVSPLNWSDPYECGFAAVMASYTHEKLDEGWLDDALKKAGLPPIVIVD